MIMIWWWLDDQLSWLSSLLTRGRLDTIFSIINRSALLAGLYILLTHVTIFKASQHYKSKRLRRDSSESKYYIVLTLFSISPKIVTKVVTVKRKKKRDLKVQKNRRVSHISTIQINNLPSKRINNWKFGEICIPNLKAFFLRFMNRKFCQNYYSGLRKTNVKIKRGNRNRRSKIMEK